MALPFATVRAHVFNLYVAVGDVTMVYVSLFSFVELVLPMKDQKILWAALYAYLFGPSYFKVC